MQGGELKAKTFRSVFWAVVRVGGSNVISFVLFSVLARVLSPAEFGVFALATLVVEFTRIVSSAGLGDAVMRAAVSDDGFADTAFWSNLALGCLVGAVTWCAAPAYADLVGQPEVTPVLRWLAALVPVASLGGIHTARNLRAFGHKAMAARVIAAGLLGGGAAIAAALAGYGVWSLVIQAAIIDVVGVAFAWQSFPWLPRLRFDRRHLAKTAGFSASMVLTQTMWLVLTRVQDIVIARFVSAAAVGRYRTAWRTIDLIAQATLQPIVGVAVITLAQVQHDPARFKAAFLRMLSLGALFTLPALLGFGVLAEEIIKTLFGAKWASSGAIAQTLTLMAIPFVLNFFTGSALAALGRSATIARVALVQAVTTVALSLVAAPFGLPWVASAYVLRAYLTMPYQMSLFRRDTGIGIWDMLGAIAPPLAASLVMAAGLAAAGLRLHGMLGQGAAYLAIAVPLGALMFTAALLTVSRTYVRSNLAALRPLLLAS